MTVGRQNKIPVDLIDRDHHTIIKADPAHALQLFLCPRSAYGIVRVTEQHQLCFRLFCKRFELCKIDFIIALAINECVQRHIAPRPAHIVIVRVIDRRLDDHIVARLRIHFDRAHQRHIDAGRIDDPLRLHIPMVAALLPVRARL